MEGGSSLCKPTLSSLVVKVIVLMILACYVSLQDHVIARDYMVM